MSSDTHVGTVEAVHHISPRIVRVTFGGPGLDGYEPLGTTDTYVSLLLPRPGASFEVPFDEAAARQWPRERRPVPRRFTVRRWEADPRRLTIDFVTHGDAGVAGRWALAATPGDRLQLRGPAGGYAPSPEADWHLFVGDESALPAIGASLEFLPATSRALLFAIVDGPADELELTCAGELTATWVHRADGATDGLLDALRTATFPSGRVHGFVHGEAGETRAVRRHLLSERTIAPDALSLSPYWRRSFDDEAWRQVKSDWLAEQEADV